MVVEKGRLILTRKPGESIRIGENIKISIGRVQGSQVRLQIDAPKNLVILREELYERNLLDKIDLLNREVSDLMN